MKKIYLLILFLVFVSPSFAQEDDDIVILNLAEKEQTEVNQEIQDDSNDDINLNILKIDNPNNSREKEYETLLYKDVNILQPDKKALSRSIEKEVVKDTSLGATYSTTEKSGQMNDSVSVYSKYEKEHFGLTTSYSQDRANLKEQGALGGSVSVAPELKLNNHVRVKNIYSNSMSTNQRKSEVVLSIRPFKDDRMDLDLGAGETFSNGNEPAKSQINFGTKFRF